MRKGLLVGSTGQYFREVTAGKEQQKARFGREPKPCPLTHSSQELSWHFSPEDDSPDWHRVEGLTPWPLQPRHLFMTIVRKEDTCGVFLPERRGKEWQQVGIWETEHVPVGPLRTTPA